MATTTSTEVLRRGLGPETAFLLTLTFAAGAVDAASLAGIDGVFAANQTGNVILAPLGLAGWEVGARVGAALAALACFVGGALIAGRLLPRSLAAAQWATAAIGVTLVHLALLCTVVVVWATAGLDARGVSLGVTALLAAGMGVQAATARRMAVPGLPTVVLTGALLGLSVESPNDISARRRWLHEVASVLTMALGALAGAVALHVSVGFALAVATGAVAVAVGIAVVTAYRRRPPRRAP